MSSPSADVREHAARAADFVADADRTTWHDASLWFIRQKRDRAAAAVPDWERLRDTAAGIKAHLLSRLDEYLEEFERNATARGIRVHWAADAAEHNAIVEGLLRERGVKRVVKSKSMLTEECGLNAHLEARGFDLVDTDLGERIVQLREEPPSHIVMPAIHLKKRDISVTFREHLGTDDGNEDPQYLTEAARQHLRERFLAAEAGITGVNFAVAATGGFVVCTNEGNADLGTSLPPLHIACMGVEKLVPRLEDLGVFLRLLTRSATGQPITAYTTHFHAPRPDGGELHVVLVDNGRSTLLGDDAFRRSLSCIRCGACMNTCPIYRRSGGHSYGAVVPGPIGSVLNPSHDLDAHAQLPFASTLCGSCTDVCPVKIDLHEQLLKWRARAVGARSVRGLKIVAMRWLGRIMARPRVYRFVTRTAKVARWLPRVLVESRLNVWARQRAMPLPARRSFRDRYRARDRQGAR